MKPRGIPWTFAHKLTDQFLLDTLVARSDLLAGIVLDVGCGSKPYQSHLGAHAVRWMGIDQPSPAAGRPAADAYGSALSLPVRSDSVDVVLSTQVIEHVPEPSTLMSEAVRVVRPGGYVIISAPQTNPLHEQPHDYFRFTRYGLEYLARTNRAEVVSIEPCGAAIALLGQLVVWHLAPLGKVPLIGKGLRNALVAIVQFVAWHADRLARQISDAGSESTIGYVLVARKTG